MALVVLVVVMAIFILSMLCYTLGMLYFAFIAGLNPPDFVDGSSDSNVPPPDCTWRNILNLLILAFLEAYCGFQS